MEKLSKIISFLFFPLFLPLYGIGMLFCMNLFSVYPLRYIHAAFFYAITCCIILPFISFYALERIGVISNVKMYNKEDRTIPMLFTSICFAICSYKLYYAAMPLFVVNIVIGTAIATLIVAIISRWWKISGHATGIGALTSSIFAVGVSTYTNTSVALCLFIFISALVISARHYLKRHSWEQLIAGYANGFIVIQLLAYSNAASLFRHF